LAPKASGDRSSRTFGYNFMKTKPKTSIACNLALYTAISLLLSCASQNHATRSTSIATPVTQLGDPVTLEFTLPPASQNNDGIHNVLTRQSLPFGPGVHAFKISSSAPVNLSITQGNKTVFEKATFTEITGTFNVGDSSLHPSVLYYVFSFSPATYEGSTVTLFVK